MSTLFETRFIVLLETRPQSNKYRQFCFSKEQFKKVSQAVADLYIPKSQDDKYIELDIEMINTEIDLPEEIQSHL